MKKIKLGLNSTNAMPTVNSAEVSLMPSENERDGQVKTTKKRDIRIIETCNMSTPSEGPHSGHSENIILFNFIMITTSIFASNCLQKSR